MGAHHISSSPTVLNNDGEPTGVPLPCSTAGLLVSPRGGPPDPPFAMLGEKINKNPIARTADFAKFWMQKVRVLPPFGF